jgi:hypothetical protein
VLIAASVFGSLVVITADIIYYFRNSTIKVALTLKLWMKTHVFYNIDIGV